MRLAIGACALVAGVAGCAGFSMSKPAATANLEPTTGNQARGTVSFRQDGDSVQVTATVTGLKPGAQHGFHVHEKGDCSSGDGMSAGGHFNPDSVAHGADAGHAGDMPNLKADASGNAHATFEMKKMTVADGQFGIVGKGLIIHRDPDDYKTQPTGNAGPRLACSVIMAS